MPSAGVFCPHRPSQLKVYTCILPVPPPESARTWPQMHFTPPGLPEGWLTTFAVVQGAFMAALYAQGLAWERMHEVVREYAGAMGSVRHLLSDLTLPIISVFSGAGFDRVIRQSFLHGAQRIEDLWLRWGQAARPCS